MSSSICSDNYYNEILISASAQGCANTVEQMLPQVSQSTKNYALIEACENNHANVVELLLVDGTDPECFYGESLLVSARVGHTEVVRLLLHHGANIKKDNSLFWASNNGHLETVKVLLEYGAQTNTSTLVKVLQQGHTDIANVLLASGVKANRMVLLEASEYGHESTVKILLEKETYSQSNLDEALICATRGAHLNVIYLLLESGANVNCYDGLPFRTSKYVRPAGMRCQIDQLFMAAGADLNNYVL